MSAIGPGTILMCIDASGPWWAGRLHVGCTYEIRRLVDSSAWTCRRCGDTHDRAPDIGIGTAFDAPSGIQGYPAPCRFVPAGRRGDFESLLQPADAPADPIHEDA